MLVGAGERAGVSFDQLESSAYLIRAKFRVVHSRLEGFFVPVVLVFLFIEKFGYVGFVAFVFSRIGERQCAHW